MVSRFLLLYRGVCLKPSRSGELGFCCERAACLTPRSCWVVTGDPVNVCDVKQQKRIIFYFTLSVCRFTSAIRLMERVNTIHLIISLRFRWMQAPRQPGPRRLTAPPAPRGHSPHPALTPGASCGLFLSSLIRKHLAHVITSSSSLEGQRSPTNCAWLELWSRREAVPSPVFLTLSAEGGA